MNAAPILFPQGGYNPAGISKVYYGFVEDFATFPALADPLSATDYESLIELATLPTLKAGKKMEEIYCTLEDGEVKSNIVGERDGKGFENSISIFFPGSTAEFNGFMASAANRQLIFLVKEKGGQFRILGSIDDPAYLDTLEATTGKKIADRRGATVSFKSSSATPPPIVTVAVTPLLTATP